MRFKFSFSIKLNIVISFIIKIYQYIFYKNKKKTEFMYRNQKTKREKV